MVLRRCSMSPSASPFNSLTTTSPYTTPPHRRNAAATPPPRCTQPLRSLMPPPRHTSEGQSCTCKRFWGGGAGSGGPRWGWSDWPGGAGLGWGAGQVGQGGAGWRWGGWWGGAGWRRGRTGPDWGGDKVGRVWGPVGWNVCTAQNGVRVCGVQIVLQSTKYRKNWTKMGGGVAENTHELEKNAKCCRK